MNTLQPFSTARKNKKRGFSILLALVLLLAGMSLAASSALAQTAPTHVYLSFGGVSVVNIDTKVTEDYLVTSNALFMAVTPDYSRLYVVENGDSTIGVFDTATNTQIDTIVMGVWPDPQVIDIEITPDGQFAYVSERWTGEVAIIETATNTVVGSVDTGNYAFGIDITPVEITFTLPMSTTIPYRLLPQPQTQWLAPSPHRT